VVRLGHGQWATPGEEPAEPSVRVGGVAVPDYLSSYQADTQEPASGPGQDAE